MRAAIREEYGLPEVINIKEVDPPKPKKDEVLVKVYHTTVNRTDCGVLTGMPYVFRFFIGLIKPSKRILGTDFAGELVEIGSHAKTFKPGDRVWGFHDEGLESQCEYMTIKESAAIVSIPENCSFKEIIACAEGAHYAINFLNKVTIHTGSKVLINGATGAIGSAALQLLKLKGAHVTATYNTKNLNLIRELGADELIDFEKVDFTQQKNRTFDFIFDAVGKSSFGKCQHLLTPKGVYISSELGPKAENIYLPLLTKLKGGKRVKFPFPSNIKSSLKRMNHLVSTGKYKPVIDRSYPLENIDDAYLYVMSGQKTGNVVIDI
ncbi:MAG: NAD(P)-dependent alcohol dehydrogenase [Fulvivirga sp.]|uniref:NAD(P)-dependent alcohol dehydrogenase n=1 Tax=Fulvivirga sp. TaxID=1931237 RepID=UPI0032F033B1